MKNKKAILWDNDGVLVDTERIFFKATKEILKKIDFEFTKEMFIESMLVKSIGPWSEIKEKMRLSDDKIKEMKYERDLLYKSLLQ